MTESARERAAPPAQAAAQSTVPGDPDASGGESGEVLQKFLRINRYLRQYATQVTEYGVRPREYSVLRFLLESSPATIGDVQGYLFRSASVASTLVAQLEEQGYVTRTRSREDNRVVLVELTEAGREIAQHAPMGGIPLLRRRLADLSPEQLALLDRAFDEVIDLMEVPDGC